MVGKGVVEGRGSGGEGVGARCHLCVVVLGTHRRLRMVVLGPHLLVLLVSCCHPRAAVHHPLFIGEVREE